MMKGTRNIGRAILAFALVGAVGFSAIACKTDADGNGGNSGNGGNGGDKELTGTVSISPSGTVGLNTYLTANYDGTETGITLTYQWKNGTAAIGGATNGNYYPTEAGSYTVTVSANNYKSITSVAVNVVAPETDTATGLIYLKSGDAYILAGRDKTTHSGDSLTVPDMYKELPVTGIAARAFLDDQLTEVILGNKVETIGDFAFQDNKLAGELTIPDSVVSIGNGAFEGYGNGIGNNITNNITKVTLGNNVETIGERAFRNNRLAGELTIPDSVVSIGASAFASNTYFRNELNKVTIGNKVETIGEYAFYYNNLTTITIGANVVISNDDAMGYYGAAFRTLYDVNGKKAGTYNRPGGTWTLQE